MLSSAILPVKISFLLSIEFAPTKGYAYIDAPFSSEELNKNFSMSYIKPRKNKEKEFADIKPTVEGAEKLGEAMGKRLAEKKITTVVFDRNGYLYHGVVKALADGARKAGIVF